MTDLPDDAVPVPCPTCKGLFWRSLARIREGTGQFTCDLCLTTFVMIPKEEFIAEIEERNVEAGRIAAEFLDRVRRK